MQEACLAAIERAMAGTEAAMVVRSGPVVMRKDISDTTLRDEEASSAR